MLAAIRTRICKHEKELKSLWHDSRYFAMSFAGDCRIVRFDYNPRVMENRLGLVLAGGGARGYQPYYVKVEAGPAPCMALNGQPRTPATTCPRWAKCEKL